MKDIEEMSDHELLMELVAEKRRNDKIRYVKYGIYALCATVVLVLGFIYVPKIVEFYNKFNAVMDTLKSTSESVQRVSDSISTETIETLNGFVTAIRELLGRFGIN